MKHYPLMEGRRGKFCFAVFMTALLFLCRDTQVTVAILGFNKSYFLCLVLICIAGAVFLAVNRKNLKQILLDRRMVVVGLATVVLLLPMLLKQDWQLMYFSILICLYLSIFLTYFITLEDAAKYYVVMMTVLGLYSVIATYFLRKLPDSGLLQVPVFYNTRDIKFHNFLFAFVSDEYVKNRNFGIFREPGVYQYFILLALMLNNYVVAWKKEIWLWTANILLAVTMLSTFATGGVAELGLLALLVFVDKKLYRKRWIWALILAALAALAAILWIAVQEKNELYWELYGMIVYKFTINESSSERMQAILSDLQYFLKSPLWGCPIEPVLHAVPNNTTSTMLMLAIFGIPGGLLHVASWAALAWRRKGAVKGNLYLLLILLLSFNTQNLIADTFFWLFPMMALTEYVLLLKKKE